MNFKMMATILIADVLTVFQDCGVKVVRIFLLTVRKCSCLCTSLLIKSGKNKIYACVS